MEATPLRADLLDGVTVAFAGDAPVVRAACAGLGAATPALEADLADEDAVTTAVAALAIPDVLVCATAAAFATAGGGLDGLRAAGDGAFVATRAVANAWIAAERPGRVVILAPGPEAGPLRAALENLARTLSIEWARYGIRPTAVLPGAATADAEVATLVAFIASAAGEYYSGCAFTLGAAARSAAAA